MLVVAGAACCEILQETAAAQEMLTELESALFVDRLQACLTQIQVSEPESTAASRQAILELFAVSGKLPIPPPNLDSGVTEQRDSQ